MKKYILPIIIACGILSLQSCKKEHETKYVNLDETVKSGETYSLDLNTYSGANARISIATQPTEFSVSQVDKDAVTSRSVYHFSTESKTQEKQKTVINITDGKSGRCSHSEDKTVITINFTVQ
ncbi:MAG: hypothetical protein QM737_21255 [Ferruginibacter sp.]